MLKKKAIFGILVIGLLIGTIFTGCVEKEEVKEEVKPKERIKIGEIIKGENVTIQKVDSSETYEIFDIVFIGEKNVKLKGVLFVPFKENGAGILVVHGIGGGKNILGADRFARAGYISLAFTNRGHQDSGGYLSNTFLALDVKRGITILENLNKIDKNLPRVREIGIYTISAGGPFVMKVISEDSRVDCVVMAACINSMWDVIWQVPQILMKEVRKGGITSSMLFYIEQAFANMHVVPSSVGEIPRSLHSIINVGLFILESGRYPVLKYTPHINTPVLYIAAENDVLCPFYVINKIFNATSSQEKNLVIVPNADHWFRTPELDPSPIEEAFRFAIEWFDKYLLEGYE
jgi:esterase/lipase